MVVAGGAAETAAARRGGTTARAFPGAVVPAVTPTRRPRSGVGVPACTAVLTTSSKEVSAGSAAAGSNGHRVLTAVGPGSGNVFGVTAARADRPSSLQIVWIVLTGRTARASSKPAVLQNFARADRRLDNQPAPQATRRYVVRGCRIFSDIERRTSLAKHRDADDAGARRNRVTAELLPGRGREAGAGVGEGNRRLQGE
jgi:hypothetical protein